MAASVDVVIPTRDRPTRLRNLLGDLSTQSVRPARTVVVDDSETIGDVLGRVTDLALRVIRPTHRVFISEAKNLGWANTDAELIAFVDDDNRLPPGLIGRLRDDLVRHPEWGAVMPGVLYWRRPDLVWVYATPFRRDRWSFELVGRNAPRSTDLESVPLATDALPNFAMVRRSVLERVGGLDPRLPVNSSADLCQRIKQAGWEVWADPSVLTYHDVEPPGVPGYWAEHTLEDRMRFRLEVADWVKFQRRWNRRRTLFPTRAGIHSLGFLGPHFLALTARTPREVLPHAAAAISGFREGLDLDLDPEMPRRPMEAALGGSRQ